MGKVTHNLMEIKKESCKIWLSKREIYHLQWLARAFERNESEVVAALVERAYLESYGKVSSIRGQ